MNRPTVINGVETDLTNELIEVIASEYTKKFMSTGVDDEELPFLDAMKVGAGFKAGIIYTLKIIREFDKSHHL